MNNVIITFDICCKIIEKIEFMKSVPATFYDQ